MGCAPLHIPFMWWVRQLYGGHDSIAKGITVRFGVRSVLTCPAEAVDSPGLVWLAGDIRVPAAEPMAQAPERAGHGPAPAEECQDDKTPELQRLTRITSPGPVETTKSCWYPSHPS